MLARGAPDEDDTFVDVRDRVFDATLAQLLDGDYCRLNLDAIATSAGVSKAALQREWPTKARLVVDTLIDRHEPPRGPAGELPGDMQALVKDAVEFLSAPIGRAIAQMASENDNGARVELLRWLGPGRAGQLAALYAAAARSALPADLDAKFIIDVIYGTVLWRVLLCAEPTSQLIDQLTGFIVDHEFPREADSSERLL